MLYDKITEASAARDPEVWTEVLHDDFTFVRHKSGATWDKAQTVEMMRQFAASDAVQEHSRRCLYENEDVLVVHSVLSFADGTSESVIAFYEKSDGLIIRTETGATPVDR